MSLNYTASERRRLAESVGRQDASVDCPACGAAVQPRPVPPPPDVAYVRRRVLILCAGCGRRGAVELPRDS